MPASFGGIIAATSQSAPKYAPTQSWLPLDGNGHPWMCERKFRSRFQAISRDLLTEVDVAGRLRTSLDGGPCRDRTYDQLIKSQLLYQLS